MALPLTGSNVTKETWGRGKKRNVETNIIRKRNDLFDKVFVTTFQGIGRLYLILHAELAIQTSVIIKYL